MTYRDPSELPEFSDPDLYARNHSGFDIKPEKPYSEDWSSDWSQREIEDMDVHTEAQSVLYAMDEALGKQHMWEFRRRQEHEKAVNWFMGVR